MNPNKPASELHQAIAALKPYFLRAAGFSVFASLLILAPSGYMLEAVSYTHLDVYKRQLEE